VWDPAKPKRMGAPQPEGWIIVNVDPVVFAKSHECGVGAGMTQWLLASSTASLAGIKLFCCERKIL